MAPANEAGLQLAMTQPANAIQFRMGCVAIAAGSAVRARAASMVQQADLAQLWPCTIMMYGASTPVALGIGGLAS